MSGLWRLRIKAIACHERRYEFTISTQLDKKKITKNTIFHFNNFFFEKNAFLSIWNSEFFISLGQLGKRIGQL